MDAWIAALAQAARASQLITNAPMAAYTTFRVGGPADALLEPASEDDIAAALRVAASYRVPITVVGNGSNLLVRDGGIRGLVMRLGSAFSRVWREDTRVYAQAGALLSAVARFAAREGLAGLAAVSGIPGSVGGAAAMNAGAYGGEMAHVVARAAYCAMDGERGAFESEALGYGYRESAMLRAGVVVTEVVLQLANGDPAAIEAEMAAHTAQRRAKQPLAMPSAGSFFKRPQGHFAGKLIEEAGLKGCAIGGAQVSTLHAGFIVNTGGARAQDLLALMAHVQQAVWAKHGVWLEPEVRIVGEDAPGPVHS